MKKRIIIANDHGAVYLKKELQIRLEGEGYEVVNCGVDSEQESVDYPDLAEIACITLRKEGLECGILLCGTGIGISMAANKMDGIRAAICSDTFSARMAREHNNANFLSIGARVVGLELAWELTKTFLQAEFKGGRHGTRVDKMMNLAGK